MYRSQKNEGYEPSLNSEVRLALEFDNRKRRDLG